MNVYVRLTDELNRGRIRAMICGGQAVVLHKLAIMSKDGDWIVREDAETTAHLLDVLTSHAATYRFGAPLDVDWLRAGWSSHFEYRDAGLRIRTDFMTRPPRLSEEVLAAAWRDAERRSPPVIGLRELAEMKKTNREKDYAVIGELARRIPDLAGQLALSRSARDLLSLADAHPDEWAAACRDRPALSHAAAGLRALEVALDAERRDLIHANERRLQRYAEASREWATAWPDLARTAATMSLPEAHLVMVERARRLLPYSVA